MTQEQHNTQDEITRLKGPEKFNVIMLNDDSTPMDFVVQVLIAIYNKDLETAKQITLEIHEKGRSIVGTYMFEIAEQKCVETLSAARSAGFPLSVTIEET
jgi:ATP-dependent Clp protease adaptor protein ClpS